MNRLVYSPDGRRIATSSFDRTAKLWDAETGEELLTFKGGANPSFSPDGQRLALGAGARIVRVLDATPVPQDIEKAFQRSKQIPLPAFWRASGKASYSYRWGVDKTIRNGGEASVFIAAARSEVEGGGKLAHVFSAENYRGKRVRLSGYIKTEDVDSRAGLWMLLEGPQSNLIADMHDRPIGGTTDWKQYDIVLDVPTDTINIVLGVALHSSNGRAWFDDLTFEIVGADIETTPTAENIATQWIPSPSALTKPLNLDFEL